MTAADATVEDLRLKTVTIEVNDHEEVRSVSAYESRGRRHTVSKPSEVRLIVQTLSGTSEDTFESDQKLQDVIDKAFRTLDIKPSPGDVWQLRYENVVLDPQTTIEENDLPDGATLQLAPHEGGGGR